MLRGMATSIFYADDLEAAKDWYAEFFGIEPYYHVPGGYYEFRIGDYQHEFGLVNRAYAPAGARNAPGGAIVHWHVDDLRATVDRLLELGATTYDPITPRGDSGFVTASVVDPFGNVLGLMSNPHYLEILGMTGPARPAPADPAGGHRAG
ncbi:VOC family protein [Nocardia farcinica]|uniref:Predicted enzyme related to lactoylglutathione lyase n=1 Tax=Nocardia farcinica TaxID=37329 RepID=A0A0H5NFA7_NOCFR|nr:VOC family protein [Nocardia farcinica]AXK88940.1 glyoxalase/bleomycin resistance/dioxygenase family protein [Nocardia farcinica]MBA4859609.1 VOC family protein [Nocardia farcinica]MBC9819288.1 VOC family protein [Nocardia farcinica]MBF6139530.1 VOC family protein [Nocardia farcinica]MBF6229909.1 VOC family protein [Nocardia farcinica]